MILKSMARKGPSFGQLINYINQGASAKDPLFSRHIMGGERPNWAEAQFLENHNLLPDRKNGNSLYHEIIALEAQEDVAAEDLRAALMKLAQYYTDLRAPRQLAYGRVHLDTKSPHIHLMISANELNKDRRKRLSQAAFRQIQIDLERFAKRELPNLKLRDIYDRSDRSKVQAGRPKLTRAEGEMIRRTGELSPRAKVAQILNQNVGPKTTWAKVQELAARMGWQLYQRGQSWGLIVEGRKHRLKSLGVEIEHDPRVLELQNFAKARLRQFEGRQHRGRERDDEDHSR